ncbi:MAG: four-carbon acid sugar kinase family protein [Chloroflexota bacterium]
MGIITDDLTGANGAAAQFAKKHLKAIVLHELSDVQILKQADVPVIDIESRTDSPDKAYQKARRAAQIFRDLGVPSVYKLSDSGLRGNIGCELDAVMDEFGVPACVLVLAMPPVRITAGGYHFDRGVPLEETELAADPLDPARESHIPTLIQAQTRRQVRHIDLTDVLAGPAALRERIRREAVENMIVVIDATTTDHLKTIAQAIQAAALTTVIGGSVGFAAELPYIFSLTNREVGPQAVVVLAGSVQEATRQQILHAKEKAGVRVVELDSRRVVEGGEASRRAADEALAAVLEAISSRQDVILTTEASREGVRAAIELGATLGLQRRAVCARIGEAMGELACRILDRGHVTLVLVGGDTAGHVYRAIGAWGTEILGEVTPLVVSGLLIGGKYAGLPVVTKAGAVGSPDALVIAIDYLHRMAWRFAAN